MAQGDDAVFNSTRRARRVGFLCVAAWTVAMLVAYYGPGGALLRRLELRTVDWRFQHRGKLTPCPDLAIVAIDEESIRALGRWPWSRAAYADLARKLAEAGARRIVFDIFFTDPDRSPGGAAGDERLAEVTRSLGNVYHSGYAYTPNGQAPPVDPRLAAGPWSRVRLIPGSGLAAVATLFEAEALTLPLTPLALAARGYGLSNLPDPEDDTYRHLVPVMRYRQRLYPSVVIALAADLLGVSPDQVEVEVGREIRLGRKCALPLDADGRMLINFAGGDHTYPYFGASDAMAGTLPAGALRGKVVLVGWTAPGINDLRACPFATVFNGVETEANALDNLLTGRLLRRTHPALTGLLMLLGGLLLAFLLPRLGTLAMCGVGVGAAVGYPWLCAWLFARYGLVLDLLSPTLLAIGAFIFVLTLRLAVEEQQRHQAHSILRHFVPPQLVGRLLDEEALTTLRGERREITVFFADLRSFTAASEELAPEDTVSFLNRYFELMHEVIWEHDGTLDKYIGDEIMGFFNAPLTQEDHARRAVMTAIDMQRRIMGNTAEWEWYGLPGLNAGIGIATGPALVGYVGSAERMQYTVIGNTVNLASRLQAQCKHLGCRILISEATYRQVAELIEAEDMGEIEIPGIQQPVHVWHVLDYRSPELRGHWGPVDEPVHSER